MSMFASCTKFILIGVLTFAIIFSVSLNGRVTISNAQQKPPKIKEKFLLCMLLLL